MENHQCGNTIISHTIMKMRNEMREKNIHQLEKDEVASVKHKKQNSLTEVCSQCGSSAFIVITFGFLKHSPKRLHSFIHLLI